MTPINNISNEARERLKQLYAAPDPSKWYWDEATWRWELPLHSRKAPGVDAGYLGVTPLLKNGKALEYDTRPEPDHDLWAIGFVVAGFPQEALLFDGTIHGVKQCLDKLFWLPTLPLPQLFEPEQRPFLVINRNAPDDAFELEQRFIPLFRRQCIIAVQERLIDPKGFNLQEVPGKSYQIFAPVFTEEKRQLGALAAITDVVFEHMLAVRLQADDLIGDEYLFIRGYRVGHTLAGESVLIVVETQVSGGCHLIDDDGRIGGNGKGHWYGMLCPLDAESELESDLKAEEMQRRDLLHKQLYRWPTEAEREQVDTSEL
jgi:hypothetical protein